MDSVIKSVKISASFVTVGAIALLLSHRTSWAIGLIIGAAWSAVNLVATISILKISILEKDPAKLSVLILVKFPVLYLIGFLILNSKAFPAPSLLTGLTLVLVTMGIYKLWLKQA